MVSRNLKNQEKQYIVSYSAILNILNKIFRTYPSSASLLLRFKRQKLKNFTSFVEFLVRKVYPIGFIKWSYRDPTDKSELGKLEELWTRDDIRDTKGEQKEGKSEEVSEAKKQYKVSWDRNTEWESLVVENVRTLIDFNVFMTPQEKKVKLEIKKFVLDSLLKRTIKVMNANSLKNVVSLCTSLIVLKKLLSPGDPSQPLYYNKENVAHTIKEIKTDNQIFKIISELLKSAIFDRTKLINQINATTKIEDSKTQTLAASIQSSSASPVSNSVESEIIDVILIPLIERMTYSVDSNSLGVPDPSKDASNQDMPVDPSLEGIGQEDDSDGVDIDIEIEMDDDAMGEDEDEGEEDEDEGEDSEDNAEPYVEQTPSDGDSGDGGGNLSLDDMMEELEGEDDEDESGSDEDDDVDDNDDESEGDDEMEVDGDIQFIDDIELDSDGEFQAIDRDHMGHDILQEEGEDPNEDDSLIVPDADPNDESGVFNVVEIDENPGNRPHFIGRPNFMEFNQNSDDPVDMLEQDLGDMGFHQIIDFLQRREGRDRAPVMLGGFNRNNRRLYEMHIGGANRRPPPQAQRAGLDGLFNIDRSSNNADFWNSNISNTLVANNRNNRGNRIYDFNAPRESLNNLLARDLGDLREQVNDRQFGIFRGRGPNREAPPAEASTSNPFDILRRMETDHKEITEDNIESMCEVKVTEKKPTKEEIERANAEKEKREKDKDKDKKQEQEKSKSKSKRGDDPIDEREELIEVMEGLELQQRSDEEGDPSSQQVESSFSQTEQQINDSDINLARASSPIAQSEPNPIIESPQHVDMSVDEDPSPVPEQSEEVKQSVHSQEEVKESTPSQEEAKDTTPPQAPPQESSNEEASNPVQAESQPPSETPAQVEESPEDALITNMLAPFGLTRQQVEQADIDPTVLQFLPEFEVVSILSEIAQNTANQPEPQQEEPSLAQAQPTSQPQAAADSQPAPQVPQLQAQDPSGPSQTPILSQPPANQIPPINQDLTSMMQSLLSMPPQNIGSQFAQPFAGNPFANFPGSQPINFNAPPLGNAPFIPPNPFGGGQQQQQPVQFAPMNMGNVNNPMGPPPPRPNQQNQPAADPQEPQLPEGIDRDFFNSLPEEYKQELLRNDDLMRQNLGQPPARPPPSTAQPEQMDTASFLATITDENLRREILVGMDEATLATLPPRVQAEARRFQRDFRRGSEQMMYRQYRREREDPDRILRHMMQRHHDHRNRDQDREERRQLEKDQKKESFMEIIKRREEKYVKPPEDLGKMTIANVFQDDKNLRCFVKILIIESQRKNAIKFDRLIKPYENLCKNAIIRSKMHQVMMLILNHYKEFAQGVLAACTKKTQIQLDSLFPPIYTLTDDGKQLEEIQFDKIALFIFKVFSYEASKYTSDKEEIIKSFFTKEDKSKDNQVQNWFSCYDKNKSRFDFITDSPFLCLLKFILAEHFHANQNDMSHMLKIVSGMLKLASDMVKKTPKKDDKSGAKAIRIDARTLDVLFNLITLKVDQDFIKQICLLFYNICIVEHDEVFMKVKHALINAILEVKQQLIELKDIVDTPKKANISAIDDIKSKMDVDKNEEEEKIDTTRDRQLNRLTGFGGDFIARPRILSATQVEIREKSLSLEGGQKLERLLKIFKMLLHQFSKHSRSNVLNQEQKDRGKFLKEEAYKIIDIKELKGLFENFSEYLAALPDNEINDTVKTVGLAMFLCYQEDFKKIDQTAFNEDFNKPHIVMEEESKDVKEKKTHNFVSDEQLSKPRVQFFLSLCLKHNKLFNTMIRQNQSLIRDSLKHVIYVTPYLFDFDNKHYFFRQELKKMKRMGHHDSIHISVNRNNLFKIFEESYEQMNHLSPEEWKGKISVTFAGERGQDAGGLTREWFTEISKQMLNPDLGMFKLSDSGSTYYPNPQSYIQGDHTNYLKFIGRIIGKALLEEQYIECSFVKALYKIIRGAPITWHDVEDYDNAYYNNLKWTLENDAEVLQQTFCESMDFFGKMKTYDLVKNGSTIPVTNENKHEYVQKVSFFKLYTSVKDQIDAFLQGFYELIPRKLISIFDHGELELLISGLPTIDVDDMKANTDYTGYSETSPVIQWFWEVLNELSNPERAEFLQFVTGSSKVPIEGFIALQGMRGPHKFNIHKAYVDDYNRLPVAHTCFNQLDLPDYPAKELLKERLLLAIREGKGSFQLV